MNFEKATQTPADYLRALFLNRKEKRNGYNTSAFARDLGISQPLLSQILNQKRPVTVAQANKIAILLDLPRKQAEAFLELTWSSLSNGTRVSKKLLQLKEQKRQADLSSLQHVLGHDILQVIAQWYPLAILDLSTTEGFQSDSRWIAKRLGISNEQAKDAIQRLLHLSLLEKTPTGGLKKAHRHLSFPTKNSKSAVRNYHQQVIDRARQELDKTSDEDFSNRRIASTTMALRMDRLEEAKKRIEKFQKDIAQFVSDGTCQEIYQLNVQFFPLTQKSDSGDVKL